MKAEISSISSNRKLGKTLTRTYNTLSELEVELSKVVSEKVSVEVVEFWLVDQPEDYLKIVKKTEVLIEIHCGVGDELSLMPGDDAQFLDYLSARIDVVKTLF